MNCWTSEVNLHSNQIPEVAAVYAISSVTGQVLYVGQTVNLRRRIFEHRCWAKSVDAARVHWSECGDKIARKASEMKLIKALKPQRNRAGVEIKHRQTGPLLVSLRDVNEQKWRVIKAAALLSGKSLPDFVIGAAYARATDALD